VNGKFIFGELHGAFPILTVDGLNFELAITCMQSPLSNDLANISVL
jgi:hypothetical protein